jgi:hypothetical protein
MAFFLSSDLTGNVDGPELLKARFAAYHDYLLSIRAQLPVSAYEFAVAEWHYNPEAPQCPHDSWVKRLIMAEPASGDRQEKRSIEIHLELLGAYHDGHIHLTYKNVKSYSLDTPPDFKLPPLHVGHGDWLTDEIRLSDRGMVLHEIEFSRGSRWLIEAEDITYEWKPIVVR